MKSNKKALSVIYKHINNDAKIVRVISAGYDRDLLERGYKGKFVIQEHVAEKAGKHWDVRLEFPVDSLRKSLGKYTVARPGTNEPIEEEYPDKAGTVLRSFVNRKREIPTSKNKVFMVETEDHPIDYGNFQGEIKEGYGKGKVRIWDKGTYELLNAEGDKKYTIDFKGKKINGIYALIKYKNGYLWIKAKEKQASAIDYIRPTLPPQLWHLDKNPPVLRDKIRTSIINTFIKTYEKAGLTHPLKWVKQLLITGSAAGFNYKESGDVDIDIIYDGSVIRKTYPGLNKLSEQSIYEYLKRAIAKTTGENIANTSHSYSFMVLEPGDKPVSDSIYDIFKNKWIKKPIPIPMDFDPDKAFIAQRDMALFISQQIDLLIGAITRTLDDLKKVDQYNKHYGGMSQKRVADEFKLVCGDEDLADAVSMAQEQLCNVIVYFCHDSDFKIYGSRKLTSIAADRIRMDLDFLEECAMD